VQSFNALDNDVLILSTDLFILQAWTQCKDNRNSMTRIERQRKKEKKKDYRYTNTKLKTKSRKKKTLIGT